MTEKECVVLMVTCIFAVALPGVWFNLTFTVDMRLCLAAGVVSEVDRLRYSFLHVRTTEGTRFYTALASESHLLCIPAK